MDENIEFTDFRFEEITYRTTLTKKFARRTPYQPPDNRKVTAFIPGTIIKVFVKEGQKVKKGEKLLTLQAMKMDNLLTASKNGTVKKVNVKQGEVVPKNFLLVELK
ncbi:MAG TPA: acetyl-CoA carboxylase biotin carboxyl carrier protein subunit [Bacteroidales bacterium]|mgnify:CR=1 FL=1|nr:acetyl-CoA carboxylase biotin carboxyl carrier protein subunit [Bacteroidales bacterium]HPS61914.1 acetyl-CoA carboxylase biotin carboxyl carrier protein subunit [Bacteroidales bacterium]